MRGKVGPISRRNRSRLTQNKVPYRAYTPRLLSQPILGVELTTAVIPTTTPPASHHSRPSCHGRKTSKKFIYKRINNTAVTKTNTAMPFLTNFRFLIVHSTHIDQLAIIPVGITRENVWQFTHRVIPKSED
jgi:hypothetical protein